MTIDEELEGLEGVAEARTSFRKQITEVIFDERRIDLDAIRRAIRAAGYEPAE
jgi:copper chaperone CopZ